LLSSFSKTRLSEEETIEAASSTYIFLNSSFLFSSTAKSLLSKRLIILGYFIKYGQQGQTALNILNKRVKLINFTRLYERKDNRKTTLINSKCENIPCLILKTYQIDLINTRILFQCVWCKFKIILLKILLLEKYFTAIKI